MTDLENEQDPDWHPPPQFLTYFTGVYNCYPYGAPSPMPCPGDGRDEIVALYLTCQDPALTAPSPQQINGLPQNVPNDWDNRDNNNGGMNPQDQDDNNGGNPWDNNNGGNPWDNNNGGNPWDNNNGGNPWDNNNGGMNPWDNNNDGMNPWDRN
jgi:hypothetical protein